MLCSISRYIDPGFLTWRIMGQYLLSLLSLLILSGANSAIAATDKECLATWKKPIVEIELLFSSPKIDHSKSAQQIEHVAKKSGYIKPNGLGNLLGLTHASFAPRIGVEVEYRKSKSGLYCLRLTKVNYEFGIRKTDIYVGRKYQKGSCAYKAILEHEQEHVRINQHVVDLYFPKVEKELERYANSIKPFYTKQLKQATQSIRNQLTFDLKPVLAAFNRDREKENGVIDNAASYSATREKCKGW